MDLVPPATALSSLVDLLSGLLQLAAAALSLAAVVAIRDRRSGRNGDSGGGD